MGTLCEISSESPIPDSSIDAAFGEIDRIEYVVSTWRDGTEISRLNRASTVEPVAASAELYTILDEVSGWMRATNGAFNPLVGPLVALWGTRYDGALPDPSAVGRALERARPDNLVLQPATNSVRLLRGATIEEGGFAKGYALDRALATLAARGVDQAVLNFGGQVAVLGDSEVVVADPENRDRPAILLRLHDASISTSSGSERAFEARGRRFSHIIDPRTGEALPPHGSVSVIHQSALVADILSTALYVMGPDEGRAWANANGIAAIFLTPVDAHVVVTLTHGIEPSSCGLRLVDDHYILEGAE